MEWCGCEVRSLVPVSCIMWVTSHVPGWYGTVVYMYFYQDVKEKENVKPQVVSEDKENCTCKYMHVSD